MTQHVVDRWQMMGALKSKDIEGLGDVIEAQLKERNIADAPEIVNLCLGIVVDLLDRTISAERNALAIERQHMNAEVNQRMGVAADFLKIVGPMVKVLSLGPYDEIASIAVRRSDGDIEIVSVTGGMIDG